MGLTDRWEGGGFIRGVRKRWVRGRGGCKHGWEGEGGDERIISHTIHFMCYFDSLRYSCFSRKYQGHQIPWRAKQSHNTNTGEMSHLLQIPDKREVGASCFFLAVVVLAQSELSRSWLSHLVIIWRRHQCAGQSRSWGGGPIPRKS